MRLFISINFNDTVKKEIEAMQNRLKNYVNGSFTGYDNLHLTLAFLGEISQNNLPKIKDAMNLVSVPEMKLVFGYTGVFQRRDGDIWWLGIESNPQLIQVHKELTQSLIKSGFVLENRPFKPHITIARRAISFSKFDKNIIISSFLTADVSKISLMLSKLGNGKPVYSELYSVGSRR